MNMTCVHCSREIVLDDSVWVDPEADGDDIIWRDVCDSHDSFVATHDPDPWRCNGCHTGDFAGFDHFCDALNVTDAETPYAFGAWLARTTSWDGKMEKVSK